MEGLCRACLRDLDRGDEQARPARPGDVRRPDGHHREIRAHRMSASRDDALHASAGRTLERVCHGLALIGGLFMVAAMLTLVVHVLGNAFGHPILGADEIVELLIGASIFCFLAPCHLQGANIVVDYFSKPLPEVVRNISDVVVTLVFALIAALLSTVWMVLFGQIEMTALTLVLTVLIFWRHRENIDRIRKGTESKIGQKG
uniref:TRAP transporter small permease protein n=1 Tax=Alloyangia mangrovi TaxID=1779329 RepID=A0A2A3K0W1_9RHOB